MSVNWVKAYFKFTEGFNAKDDDKTDDPPALAKLENGIFQKVGSIRKRNGYTALGTNDASTGSPVSSRMRNVMAREDETVAFHEDRLYSQDPILDNWVRRGDYACPILSSAGIADSTTNQLHASQARNGSVIATAWLSAQQNIDGLFVGINKVSYEIRNAQTGTVYVAPTIIGTDYIYHPHVITTGPTLRIWTMRGDASAAPVAIRRYDIDPANPVANDFSSAGSGTDAVTDTFSIPYFDIIPSIANDGTTYVAYVASRALGATEIVVQHIASDGITVLASIGHLTAASTQIKLFAISQDPYGSSRIGLAWVEQDPGGGNVSDIIKAEILTSALVTVSGVQTIDTQPTGTVTSPTTFIKNMMVAWMSSTLIDVVYTDAANTFDLDPPGPPLGPLHYTVHTQMNTAGAVVGAAGAVFKYNVAPTSRAFYRNGFWFAWFGYESDLQSTDFLIRSDGLICGKSMQGVSQGFTDTQIALENATPANITLRRKSPFGKYVTDIETVSANIAVTVLPFKKRLDTTKVTTMSSADMSTTTLQNNPLYTVQGLRNVQLDFDHQDGYRGVEAGDVVHLNGGMLWEYDGRAPVEHGFHLFPEGYVGRETVSIGPTSMAVGTYGYRFYYEWVNALGYVEKSSTSGPVAVTITGLNDAVRLRFPFLNLTGKSGVRIGIYRTEVNPVFDSPYYRVANAGNVSPSFIGSFRDEMDDATLVRQELDPLNGGQLDNIAPPAPAQLAEGKGRIFLVSQQDDSLVRYSKVRSNEAPFEFNDALSIAVEDGGGNITGISVMNESLVIFKRERVYVVSGDGPNNLGFGTFSEPQRVSSDVGAISHRSIVQTPLGLMFESPRGIYLLTQQFQLKYIGANVEGVAGTVTASTIITDSNRVVFLCSSGSTVVYDFFFGHWSEWTNHLGLGAALIGGLLRYVRSDKLNVYKENTTSFLDAGTNIQLLVRPGPLKAEGLNNFQRVRKVELVGNYKSPHRLIVGVRYDYSTGAFQEFNYDPDTVAEQDPYQFRFFLPRQKCMAMQLQFRDAPLPPALNMGESVELTEFAVEAAIKDTLNKTANRAG